MSVKPTEFSDWPQTKIGLDKFSIKSEDNGQKL